MARLSTHVLDTGRGAPAGGLRVELYDSERRLLRTAVTNPDGRLLAEESIETGVYELVFYAGDYFRAIGVALADPPFVDVVTVRFGIADPLGNYHVPLLVSPYAYSTYRGS